MAVADKAADFVVAGVRYALTRLGEEREEIDRLNVFPVPDGDTGTNMYLTLESAVLALDAMTGDRPDGALAERWQDAPEQAQRMLAVTQTLARGALLGARGNSGVILSQILRGMLHSKVRALPDGTGVDTGYLLASGLSAASDLAYQAVGNPLEGTILTVIRVAAESASAAAQDGAPLLTVLSAAADGARDALALTPTMLPALAQAGVVDSGGAGLVVILDALLEVLSGRARPARQTRQAVVAPPDGHAPAVGYDGPGYEVMYLLDAPDERIPQLRRDLAALGDSLVVVGGDRLWNVHVHVDDAGAAIEAAMALGQPYRIRIQWLREAMPVAAESRSGRAVIAVSHGEGVAAMLEQAGAAVVPARPRISPSTGELLAAVEASGAAEVVLLPGGKDIRPAAEAAAARAREQGVRVAVVPTRAIVQSLAAVAVHDPDRGFDDDVAAMSRASGATRYGGVTISSKTAMTSAGLCRPGDVLGLVSGDIVTIGSDEVQVAIEVVAELVSADSELVTLLAGADMTAPEVEALGDALDARFPQLDVVAEFGGQPLWPVIIGVE